MSPVSQLGSCYFTFLLALGRRTGNMDRSLTRGARVRHGQDLLTRWIIIYHFLLKTHPQILSETAIDQREAEREWLKVCQCERTQRGDRQID
jgi:hypothetical protein